MNQKPENFFSRYEFLLPLILFILFLVASLPGITWGSPALWNPDELVWRVDSALRGELKFDETEPDWNYPSLPKYVMYFIGWVVYGMGKSSFAFIVAARVFSSILGAIGGVLIYFLARNIGINKKYSFLAGILYIVSGIAAANGRFAHNDLYLQLFTILCVYCLIKYQAQKTNAWLYASFLCVGLATSSKYTGGSLMFLPVIVYITINWSEIRTNWLRMLGVLVCGGIVAFIGYVIGTPKSLIDPINYFINIMVVLGNLRSYGFNYGTRIGLFGQWGVLKSTVGVFCYYLFILSFVWVSFKLLLQKTGKIFFEQKTAQAAGVFILALLIFDIPYLVSINYIDRYFIPFVPFFAILAVLFLRDLIDFASKQNWKWLQFALISICIIGLSYSALRLVSVSLLFINDARIPATAYIATIRGYQKSIEYTLYPPLIEKRRFMRAHNYPIYFVEWIGDDVPTGGRFEYNQGEKGLLERDTDYFVIDSFTYARFGNPSVCATTPVECDFFKKLIDGEIRSYRLLKEFTYQLPTYLPQVRITAVNPDILIFERAR
ncbi:MAG: phospholipid carrier-dependent glycosyltransferase [Anaerolineales bacterium]|nr:phospholipid carrier-dependent glycosyltransferase [Anaerolineales bacterium]